MTKEEFIFSILSLGWKRYSNQAYKFKPHATFTLFLHIHPDKPDYKKPVKMYLQNNLTVKHCTYLDAYKELTKND